MIKFKNTHIDNPDIAKGASITMVWEFEGDPNQIKNISPGCGCTANCKKVGNTVVATFTDPSGNVDIKHYPAGKFPYKKNINVFLEESEVKIDGMNKTTTAKGKITLTFSGNVLLK